MRKRQRVREQVLKRIIDRAQQNNRKNTAGITKQSTREITGERSRENTRERIDSLVIAGQVNKAVEASWASKVKRKRKEEKRNCGTAEKTKQSTMRALERLLKECIDSMAIVGQ